MKEETNNEMDLLLRRLTRRPDRSVSDTNGDIDHLDADELSAYVENVLPAAARVRYTEHLAECARCRDLVVQLSSSAGVIPVIETVKAPEPSALRKFLASLFSPLVLRYAVPALGLIIVAAIGLFVLQQNKNKDRSIAQNAEPSKYTSVATPNVSAPQAPASATYDLVQKEPTATKPAQGSGSPSNQIAAAPEAPPPAAINGNISRDDLAKKEQQQPVVTDAPAAAAPKPTTTPEVSEQQAKSVEREEAAQARVSREPPANKTEEAAAKVKAEDRKAAEVKRARSAPSANEAGGFSALTTVPSTGTRSKTDKDSEGEDKTRNDSNTISVAGRRFRKQGGVWVDTAFNFSRDPINVTRGSEQYRALIADEPAIKTIADQLDGEILVLWKGRPYRIK